MQELLDVNWNGDSVSIDSKFGKVKIQYNDHSLLIASSVFELYNLDKQFNGLGRKMLCLAVKKILENGMNPEYSLELYLPEIDKSELIKYFKMMYAFQGPFDNKMKIPCR